MASTRAMTGDDGLLGAAETLRWARPDLAAAIADHVLDVASSSGDDVAWLSAAGWAVHARSATGDGREFGAAVLAGIAVRGSHLLDHPAADRLRVELAVLAAVAGRASTARTLLTPVTVADTSAELRADALCALARCAMQDRPSSVDGLISRVEATWAEVGGKSAELGSAMAAYVAASAERRSGRAHVAVDRAVAGLARLGGAPAGHLPGPSPHLAAGLAAEWISGLLGAGRTAEARLGCIPLGERLREPARPCRQLALLRLTVARTVAASTVAATDTAATIDAVDQAARDAAASDAPDLESVCWSTLGALQDAAGRTDRATAAVRLGVDARHRDEQRGVRFRAALDSVVPPACADGVPDGRYEPVEDGGPSRESVPASSAVWTDWSSAVARDRGAGASGPGQGAGRRGAPERPVPAGAPPISGVPATGWNGTADVWGVLPQRERANGHGRNGGLRPAGGGPVGDPLSGAESDAGSRLRAAGARRRDRIGGAERRAPDTGPNGHDGADRAAAVVTPADTGLPLGGPSRTPEPGGDVGSLRDAGRELHADPWDGWTDDSPIGRLLARSLQPATETDPPAPPRGATGLADPVPLDPVPLDAVAMDAVAVDAAPVDAGQISAGQIGAGQIDAAGAGAARVDAARVGAAWVGAARVDGGQVGAGRVDAGHVEGPTSPWSTGSWSAARWRRPVASAGWIPSDGASASVGPGGRRRRGEDRAAAPDEQPAARPADEPAVPDRVPARPADRPGQGTEGCVVVVDLARDGRRFAGRRAATVVRAVADRLDGRLPDGGRLRHDESDALSIVLPGWSRSPAADWMHRTLPEVFDDVVTAMEFTGTQLRAAVHDIDGPVGAQLLQRLHAGGERSAAAGRHDAAGRTPFRVEEAPAGGRRRRRQHPDAQADTRADSPSDVRPDVRPDSRPDSRPDTVAAPLDAEISTDGLGLADLLAGALAAYRSI